MSCQKLLVTEPILKREQRRVLMQQRGNQFRQGVVICRLQGDEHEIAGSDRLRCFVGTNLGETEAFLLPADLNSEPLDFLESAPHQKTNVVAMVGQLAAIVAPDRGGADDRNTKIHEEKATASFFFGGIENKPGTSTTKHWVLHCNSGACSILFNRSMTPPLSN